MTIQDYLMRIEQKRANNNISLICLKQRHKDIAKEVSRMLREK